MDIFKIGNLVSLVHDDHSSGHPLVVEVTGPVRKYGEFPGTVMCNHPDYAKGENHEDWDCGSFEQHTGETK